MLTLAAVLVAGALIILLGFTLEDLIFWIDKRRKIHKHSRLEWVTNETLQTQRLAHEELGIGPWEGCASIHDVPVMVEGQLLAILDIRDPTHPRLRIPTPVATKPDSKLEAATTNCTEESERSELRQDESDQSHGRIEPDVSSAEQTGGSHEQSEKRAFGTAATRDNVMNHGDAEQRLMNNDQNPEISSPNRVNEVQNPGNNKLGPAP